MANKSIDVQMKVIRFWTSHPNSDPRWWLANFQLKADDFSFVYDAIAPNYLFATEHIYINHLVRKRFVQLYDRKRVAIYYADECITPDMNVFDYAVVFDKGMRLDDRVARRPPLSFVAELFNGDLLDRQDVDAGKLLKEKRGFCNFIYSNPNAHPRRDQIFHSLSTYKRVDSLGPHLHNSGNQPSRAVKNWADALVEMKRPYKFSISCENASYKGYITEKIVSSFLAHTIPVYWGAPGCAEEFNPEAFVDASKMSDAELIATVKRIDEDDDLWMKMIAAPPMTDAQKASYLEADRQYRDFCRKIFEQTPSDAKRVPVGYWTDNYLRYFFAAKGVPLSPRERFYAALGRYTELVDKVISWIRH